MCENSFVINFGVCLTSVDEPKAARTGAIEFTMVALILSASSHIPKMYMWKRYEAGSALNVCIVRASS